MKDGGRNQARRRHGRTGAGLWLVAMVALASWLPGQKAGAQGWNVEAVSQTGGGCHGAVHIEGNYAYIGDGFSLVVFDVSDPSSPEPLGRVLLPHWCLNVDVSGGLAYVACHDAGLQIVDISNPESPTVRGWYDTPAPANDVRVIGNLAYVVNNQGLQIIDVSDPAAPTLRGFYDTPAAACDVYVVGDLVYITANQAGLLIVDVSDPSAPTLLGQYGNFVAYGVHVAGNLAYVCGPDLHIIDVSDPAAPTLRGFFAIAGGHGSDLYVAGGLAYVACSLGPGRLRIVDVSDPSAPKQLGQYGPFDNGHLDTAHNVRVEGGLAYVVSCNGLRVIDVSDPATPTLHGSYDTPGGALSVWGADASAYVGWSGKFWGGGLQIIDARDPSAPTLRGSCATPGPAREVRVTGDLACVIDDHGLEVIDVSDPSSPTLSGSYDTPNWPTGLCLADGLAYLAWGEWGWGPSSIGGMQIVDISDPASPTLCGSYEALDYGALGVDVANGLAHVIMTHFYYSETLHIIDVSDPTSPTLQSYCNAGYNAQDVCVTRGLAFVAGAEALPGGPQTPSQYRMAEGAQLMDDDLLPAYLLVYDVSVPSNPVLVGSYDALSGSPRVCVTGGLAFLACGSHGLQILDVSDPTSPVLCGSWPFRADDVYVTGRLVYVVSDSGLWILRYTGPWPGPLEATVDIKPETLNLKSRGRWVTCFIELPEECDVGEIDVGSLLLDGTVAASAGPTAIGDYDADGVPDLMVKFPRDEVIAILDAGENVEVLVTGMVSGEDFAGTDTIRVIRPGIGPKLAVAGRPLEFSAACLAEGLRGPVAYSAENLPAGATLDPATGWFRWTPAPGQVGVYPDVVLRATSRTDQVVERVMIAAVLGSQIPVPPPEPDAKPLIGEVYSTDADGDRIDDRLLARLRAARADALAAVTAEEQRKAAVVLNKGVVVELIFNRRITRKQIETFLALGGEIDYVYRAVSYGWNGRIALDRVDRVPPAMGGSLVLIDEPGWVEACMQLATQTGRVRPVWASGYAGNPLGFDGDPSITIGFIDGGLDATHTDLAGRMVYWLDFSTDGEPNPIDARGHGTHMAGIALGTGDAGGAISGPIYLTDLADMVWWRTDGPGMPFVPFPIDIPPNRTITVSSTAIWDRFDPTTLTWGACPSGSIFDYSTVIGDAIGPSPLSVSGSFTTQAGCHYGTMVFDNDTMTYFVVTSSIADYPAVGDGFNRFRGVAPGCNWAAAKVLLNATGIGQGAWVNAAIDSLVADRVTHNIKIMNLSLSWTGSPAINATRRQKVNTAVRNGIVFVVSAGNDGEKATAPEREIEDPARAALALTLAAVNDVNEITAYTNHGFEDPSSSTGQEEGHKPDLAAPGGSPYYSFLMGPDSNTNDGPAGNIGDQQANDYSNYFGTSRAASFVAGCAALVIDAMQQNGVVWDHTSPRHSLYVKMLLCATATETNAGREVDYGGGAYDPTLERAEPGPLGYPIGKDRFEGYGMVNPDAAVEAVCLEYLPGKMETATLGPTVTDRRAWARRLTLVAGRDFATTLTNPAGGDFDLYLYSDEPSPCGEPVLLASSTNAGPGGTERIAHTPSSSGRGILVVKRVSGSGEFALLSSLERELRVRAWQGYR